MAQDFGESEELRAAVTDSEYPVCLYRERIRPLPYDSPEPYDFSLVHFDAVGRPIGQAVRIVFSKPRDPLWE